MLQFFIKLLFVLLFNIVQYCTVLVYIVIEIQYQSILITILFLLLFGVVLYIVQYCTILYNFVRRQVQHRGRQGAGNYADGGWLKRGSLDPPRWSQCSLKGDAHLFARLERRRHALGRAGRRLRCQTSVPGARPGAPAAARRLCHILVTSTLRCLTPSAGRPCGGRRAGRRPGAPARR